MATPAVAASQQLARRRDCPGGLHHLATFGDVALALAEMQRVVVPDGRVVIIEPWLTPFLRAVHVLTDRQVLRRLIPKSTLLRR